MSFTAFALLAFLAAPAPTARQVIERIQKHVGVPWSAQTVDTFKTGSPDARVTGIVTTFTATMDVLRQAVAAGSNLVITHEPTFYNHLDQTDGLAADPVYLAKREYIDRHGLIVWRFHDHWHRRSPDGIMTGMAAALGWKADRSPLFVLPETTLERLAADLRERLRIRVLRVVGDPAMRLTRAALLPGASGAAAHLRALRRDDVEVLIIGESNEWETVEYVRDAAAQGRRKALILLGHVPSEQAGMDECARWLRTFVPEVPVAFIPAAEPFWSVSRASAGGLSAP